MGRPSKFDNTKDKILANIRLGMRYTDAAMAAGISYNTFNEWRKKGDKAKSGKYHEFCESLYLSEAEGERQLIARIQKAAQGGTWQAAAWILERRHREKWGRNLDVTSDGKEISLIINIGEDI